MENPFSRKGIRTITVKQRNQSYSEYYINDSDTPHTLERETLELFLKQAFPRLSFKITEAFFYYDHDPFWIDVKRGEYHKIELDDVRNYEELRQDMRRKMFDISEVEKEVKKERGSKQKPFKKQFSKTDGFFKRFSKKNMDFS